MTNTNKGGYQILDLGNVDLTTSPTIEGLYELIEGTKKPIRLTRINLGGVEKHDVVSMPVVSGSDYVFENIYGYDLSIDSDGNLSLASTKWASKTNVESLVEGGTLDNAKPIYFHPITGEVSGTLAFALTILDNSNTSYNTWTKLKAKMIAIKDAIHESARFNCSGGFVKDGSSYHAFVIVCETNSTISIFGVDENGAVGSLEITNLSITPVYDPVNKIN